MLDHGYPKDWSTLKKLIWQWQAAGGGSLPWAIFTGNPVEFNAPKAHVLRSLKASFSPVQDLHGYANPWPPGGGDQLIPYPYTFGTTDTKNGITATANNDGSIKLTGTASNTAYFNLYGDSTAPIFDSLVEGETYYISGYEASKYFVQIIFYGETNFSKFNGSFVVPTKANYTGLAIVVGVYNGANFGTTGNTIYPMLNKGNTAKPFAPYSNECPISGWTGANIYDDPAYGGTIEWNQLVEPLSGARIDRGITYTSNADGSFSFSGTATNSYSTFRVINTLTAGNKFYVRFSGTGDANLLNLRQDSDGSYKSWHCINQISILPSGTVNVQVRLSTLTADSSYSGTFFLEIFDLTAMFGAGKEPATVDAFRELFPKDYYAFDDSYTETTVSAVNGNPWWKVSVTWQDEAGTVYGGYLLIYEDGSVDLVGTMAKTTYDGTENWAASSSVGTYYLTKSSTNFLYKFVSDVVAVSDTYDYYGTKNARYYEIESGQFLLYWANTLSGTREVAFKNTNITTLQAWKDSLAENNVSICYELATPVTYHLPSLEEAIRCIQGINTMWTDADNLTVEARAESVQLNALQSLNMLLGGRYVNNHGADEPTDEEALRILMGGER